MEDSIAGLAGIDMIHSYSARTSAWWWCASPSTPPSNRAVQEVRDKVALVRMVLPKEADAPTVSRVDLSTTPILTYGASAQLSSLALRKEGWSTSWCPSCAAAGGGRGARARWRHPGDPGRRRARPRARRGVAPGQVAERVGSENLDLPAGRLQLGPTELTVRSLGQFHSIDDIRALPVAKGATGTQVRLDEIALVRDGTAERRTLARLNGHDSIIVEVVKQPGSNTVAVADKVKEKLKKLEPAIGHGFKASLLVDQSAIIRENTDEVWVALVFGA